MSQYLKSLETAQKCQIFASGGMFRAVVKQHNGGIIQTMKVVKFLLRVLAAVREFLESFYGSSAEVLDGDSWLDRSG